MPKDSYESSNEIAVNNALRFINEAGCDAVKLEGGAIMCDRVKAIRASGIQVMGHIGLTPQSASTFGGYRVVGRSESEKTNLVKDFNELKMAGAFAVLLEAVPPSITKEIVKNSTTIVLGIGAGVEADGQLLIIHDLLGLYPDFRPKFAKNFIIDVIDQFSESITTQEDIVEFGRKTRKDGIHELSRLAVEKYISDCKSKKFPSLEYTYKD
jgi:3-methyl-2-oxobutanoate hydroxymethyltransferase